MSFKEIYYTLSFRDVANKIHSMRNPNIPEILDRAVGLSRLDPRDLMALLSPGADLYLEQMAHAAKYITQMRFGNAKQLYAPLYLSNECRSGCTYCGFAVENQITRLTLSPEEAVSQANHLYNSGIRHILLLTGEDLKATPVSYIARIASMLKEKFVSIGIEVYPLKEEEYVILRENGVDSLTLYQETYDPDRYREVHLRGMKTRMDYRLDAPDRAGRAGFRKIQIGALMGLSNQPEAEIFFIATHALHLIRTHWKTQTLIGLPRMRSAAGLREVPVVPDRLFARFLFALRIYLPDAGLVLSTRESPVFRDHMADLCITQMSAGSRTDPGGYPDSEDSQSTSKSDLEMKEAQAGEQFHVEDHRSVSEIADMLKSKGLDPVTVDWSSSMK